MEKWKYAEHNMIVNILEYTREKELERIMTVKVIGQNTVKIL